MRVQFQVISLIQIVEDMLLNTPTYLQLDELPLYVPGSLLERHFVFPSAEPVLYVSPHNPGAREVAIEMQASFKGIVLTDTPPPTLVSQRSQRRSRGSVRSNLP
eukprot:6896451-Prymnesium_polylepis.1